MKRTLPFAILFFLVASARADLLIERFSGTTRYTGAGTERTLRISGYIVVDFDGTNGAAVETANLGGQKFYAINRESVPAFRTTVQGTRGREYTVGAYGATETNEVQLLKLDGLLSKGLNTELSLSESRRVVHPRVMRGSNHRVEFTDGAYRLLQSSVIRTFAQTDTRAANAAGEDVEVALARIIARLERAGYRPVPQ
jgi:hypothetical protein